MVAMFDMSWVYGRTDVQPFPNIPIKYFLFLSISSRCQHMGIRPAAILHQKGKLELDATWTERRSSIGTFFPDGFEVVREVTMIPSFALHFGNPHIHPTQNDASKL
jgi:hypothetical protein